MSGQLEEFRDGLIACELCDTFMVYALLGLILSSFLLLSFAFPMKVGADLVAKDGDG